MAQTRKKITWTLRSTGVGAGAGGGGDAMPWALLLPLP